jgi:hypothetical protein
VQVDTPEYRNLFAELLGKSDEEVQAETGLMPDYAEFDGSPIDPWDGGHDAFRFDAWRNGMNVAVDQVASAGGDEVRAGYHGVMRRKGNLTSRVERV